MQQAYASSDFGNKQATLSGFVDIDSKNSGGLDGLDTACCSVRSVTTPVQQP